MSPGILFLTYNGVLESITQAQALPYLQRLASAGERGHALPVEAALLVCADIAHALSHVGLAYFGAVLGGAVALAVPARVLPLDALRFLDLSVPGLALAHAVGRVGCLLGGCCYGAEWRGPLALPYGAETVTWRHPVPLYEAAFLLVLGTVLALRPLRGAGSGRPLAVYFALYAAFRIGIEGFRGDPVRGIFFGGRVSTSEIAAALVLAVCLAWLAVGRQAPCASLGPSRSPSRSPASRPPTWRGPTLRAGWR